MAENPTDNSYQDQRGYPDAPPSYDESMNAGAAGKLNEISIKVHSYIT